MTAPATSPAVTARKVPAVRIELAQAEGCYHGHTPTADLTGPGLWERANRTLSDWSITAPRNGSYHKTDYRVTYADGEVYRGTLGLNWRDHDLVVEIRETVEAVLGCPDPTAFMPGTQDRIRAFAVTHEIG